MAADRSPLAGKKRLVSMVLKRHGERGEVLREQPGATDEYGKPATTYQQVATEAMYRSYTLDTTPHADGHRRAGGRTIRRPDGSHAMGRQASGPGAPAA
jgi:hypothetical protein